MLKKQHFEILSFIEKNNSLADLAEKFSLTERSIRYKIEEINEGLGEKRVEIKKRKIFTDLKLNEVKNLFHRSGEESYVYIQEERQELIILYTLFEKDTFSLREISEKLGTSKSTVRNDLKIIRKKLEKYGIRLLQDEKLKYYFDYSEEDYRFFMTIYLYKYISLQEYERNDQENSEYLKKIVFGELGKSFLTELYKKYIKIKEAEFPYADETLEILTILSLITKKREDKNIDLKSIDILKEREDYKKIKEIFLEFKEESLLFLTNYLFRISREENDLFIKYENWLEIVFAISKMITEFGIDKNVRFKNLDLFFNELLFYIKPSIFRTKKKIILKNYILKEVKELYPDSFEELKKNYRHLEDVIGEKFSDEEIAFFVPFYQKYLLEENKKEKKGILFTSYKENIALFLKESIESEFSISIDKIYTLKDFDENLDFKDIDYIISTIALEKNKIKTKVIEVNPILTEKDIKKLEDEGLIKNRKIRMSSLLKIILENTQQVDVKKLMNNLKESFPEKIYNDVEKEKFSLENFLSYNTIFETNFTTIYDIINEIRNKKDISINYIKKIEKNIEKKEKLIYLENGILVVYENPTKTIKGSYLIVINNKNEINYKNKKIKTVIFMYSENEYIYREMIFTVVKEFFKSRL